ncbi:MAG: LysR family transcriptional regulator [Lachnospiraceae bacterium]|nr:LysR family transcriptional regulator [Lachnospiraceae bacterium]
MRSSQIENFFALAQYKNFSKAAEYCFITQPALSKNIWKH